MFGWFAIDPQLFVSSGDILHFVFSSALRFLTRIYLSFRGVRFPNRFPSTLRVPDYHRTRCCRPTKTNIFQKQCALVFFPLALCSVGRSRRGAAAAQDVGPRIRSRVVLGAARVRDH